MFKRVLKKRNYLSERIQSKVKDKQIEVLGNERELRNNDSINSFSVASLIWEWIKWCKSKCLKKNKEEPRVPSESNVANGENDCQNIEVSQREHTMEA